MINDLIKYLDQKIRLQLLGSPCHEAAERPKYSSTARVPQANIDLLKLLVVNPGIYGRMVVSGVENLTTLQT